MTVEDFLTLPLHLAEEYLQNPECSDEIKREYLGEYDDAADKKITPLTAARINEIILTEEIIA